MLTGLKVCTQPCQCAPVLPPHKSRSRLWATSTREPKMDSSPKMDLPVAVQEGISIVDSSFEGGLYTVRGLLASTASADEAYNILLDIGNSHNVYRNITKSEVWFTEDGDKRLTEFCGWNFLIFAGTFPVVLDVTEGLANRTLDFNMIKCKFMKEMKGHWEVHGAENGGCTIDHTLSVKPVMVPPSMIGSFTKKIFSKQVVQILEDLDQELKKS